MTYTITNNATMGAETARYDGASEALEAALRLQATGHRTVLISDGEGTPLSLAELEARVREA